MGIQYFSVLGLANTHGMKILWPLLAKSIYIGIQYFGVLSQAKSHGMKILWLCLAQSDSIFWCAGLSQYPWHENIMVALGPLNIYGH